MMNDLKSMLVCLDLTELDEELIAYARFYSEKAKIGKVFFAHNIKIYALGEDSPNKSGKIDSSVAVRKEIHSLIENLFGEAAPYEVIVSEDPKTEVVLSDIIHQYKIPLAMIGRKTQLEGTGVMGKNLINIIPASVLVVPEASPHHISRILVPMDFSEGSVQALKTAYSLSCQGDASSEILFIKEQSTQKADPGEKEFEALKEQHPEYATMHFSSVSAAGQSIASGIHDHQVRHTFDFIVLGHRGSNPIHSQKAGSVPAGLYSLDLTVPMLMVYS